MEHHGTGATSKHPSTATDNEVMTTESLSFGAPLTDATETTIGITLTPAPLPLSTTLIATKQTPTTKKRQASGITAPKGGGGNLTNTHKNKRNKEKVNHSFDPDGSKSRHPGSYAVPEQRQLFYGAPTTLPPPPHQSVVLDGATTTITTTTKKKVAISLGYLGTSYGGFQINQGVRSIQAELEWALRKCGFISEANFGYPSKTSWSTSGRTDKGVHAAAQTISFKMELSADQLQATTTTNSEVESDDKQRLILNPLNAQLPRDIHVWDVNRTTRNFCAKTIRDRVRYQFLIPSYILSPLMATLLLHEATTAARKEGHELDATTLTRDTAPPDASTTTSTPPTRLSAAQIRRIQEQVASYRATPDQLHTLSAVLQQYVGTHSFHNFTRRCAPSEMRAKRFILEFAVDHPILVPVQIQMPNQDGLLGNDDVHSTASSLSPVVYEWIPTSVTGQSFLLNQIRKMVGLALDVTRGVVPMESVADALDGTLLSAVPTASVPAVVATTMPPTLNDNGSTSFPSSGGGSNRRSRRQLRPIGIAPAQGLFLDMSFYTNYNRRKAETSTTAADATAVPPPLPDLDWSRPGTAANKRWKAFRDGVIVPHVVEEEAKQGNFLQYLYQRDHVYTDDDHEGDGGVDESTEDIEDVS